MTDRRRLCSFFGFMVLTACAGNTLQGPPIDNAVQIQRRVAPADTSQTINASGASFTFFPVSFQPGFIAQGADGNLWFTGSGVATIGRLTPSGQETDYPISTASKVETIAAGPDGALWFTEPLSGTIGRITTQGTVSEYQVIPGPYTFETFWGIAAGSDGAIWFTEPARNSLGRLTTTGSYSEIALPPISGLGNAPAVPTGVAAGQGGVVSFTAVADSMNQPDGDVVGEVSATGDVSYRVVDSTSGDAAVWIAKAQDTSLWFITMSSSEAQTVSRLGNGKRLQSFSVPAPPDTSYGFTAGYDDSIWFTQVIQGNVIRVDRAGHFKLYPVPNSPLLLLGITRGPDHAYWFVEDVAKPPYSYIGKLVP